MIKNTFRHLNYEYSILTLNTFFERLLGALYFSLKKYDALIFTPGDSVHTFFMRYPIDIYFLNEDKKIICHHKNVLPWKMIFAPKGTKFTIEAHNKSYDIVCRLIDKWRNE